MSLFTYRPEDYTRNVDIVNAYIHDCATYASRMTGKPYDACVDFIVSNMKPGGLKPLKDPEVLYLQRAKNGDRNKKTGTFTEYLKFVEDNKLIMAPTMTVYLNPNQRKSKLGAFIDANLQRRKAAKDKKFDYKMSGDKAMESYYDGLQTGFKLDNNSLSGAHASPFNILYNKSSHSTLTSTCRISTSYANANGEWFLAGNRHFWCPQVVVVSLLAACRHTDFAALEAAVVQFSLYNPEVKDVMECIHRSSDLYWFNETAMAEIEQYVKSMTPLERAAFVYNCDLHHLAKHNDSFVRQFLGELSQQMSSPIENPDDIIKQCDSDTKTLMSLICADLIAGRTLKDIKKDDPFLYGIIGHTAFNILTVLDKYKTFIHGVWRPSVLPPSIAVLPNIVRRAVITSDTDSTIFTNQAWTEWFTNGDSFSLKAYQIGYTTTFLNSQMVKHKLALMSANIGVIKEHIHKISMKNEYYFPVYCLTPSAKHYFAYRSAQEGNILPEIETEIKGVHLRDSTAPAIVTRRLKRYMEEAMDHIMEKGHLTLDEVLGPIAEIELAIKKDIETAGFMYMKATQIKSVSSYVKGEEAANYKHYMMWNEVFAPIYGPAPEPPYQAVKVSVDLDTRQKFNDWIATLEDKELGKRFADWMESNGRTNVTTFILPLANLQVYGIPKEIISAINMRKLIMNMVAPFYLVLEAFGIYLKNENITRLISDTYSPKVSLAAA